MAPQPGTMSPGGFRLAASASSLRTSSVGRVRPETSCKSPISLGAALRRQVSSPGIGQLPASRISCAVSSSGGRVSPRSPSPNGVGLARIRPQEIIRAPFPRAPPAPSQMRAHPATGSHQDAVSADSVATPAVPASAWANGNSDVLKPPIRIRSVSPPRHIPLLPLAVASGMASVSTAATCPALALMSSDCMISAVGSSSVLDVVWSTESLHPSGFKDRREWQQVISSAVQAAVEEGRAHEVVAAIAERLLESDEMSKVWAADVITEVGLQLRRSHSQQALPHSDEPEQQDAIERPLVPQLPVFSGSSTRECRASPQDGHSDQQVVEGGAQPAKRPQEAHASSIPSRARIAVVPRIATPPSAFAAGAVQGVSSQFGDRVANPSPMRTFTSLRDSESDAMSSDSAAPNSISANAYTPRDEGTSADSRAFPMEALLAFGGCVESPTNPDVTESGDDATKSACDFAFEGPPLTRSKSESHVITAESRVFACTSAADSVLQALQAEVIATTSALESLKERVLSVSRWKEGLLAFRSNTELSKSIWHDLMLQQEATDVMLAALAPAGCLDAALMRSGILNNDRSLATSAASHASRDVNQRIADISDMTDATTASHTPREVASNSLDEVAWGRSASLTKLRTSDAKVPPLTRCGDSLWDAKAWDAKELPRSGLSPRMRRPSSPPLKGQCDDGGGQTKRALSTSRGAGDTRRPAELRQSSGGRVAGRTPRRQRS